MIKDIKNFTITMSVLKDLMDMSSDQNKINETLNHLEDQIKNYRPKMNLSFVNKSDNPDPVYHYGSDSGFDLLSNVERKIPAGTRTTIPTGLYFDIPYGYEIQVRSKSGLALNKGLLRTLIHLFRICLNVSRIRIVHSTNTQNSRKLSNKSI